jgi:putative FmdB family regulatory protein
MPLYEYQCEACAHRFERIQKFSDLPIETCPTCGGAVRKLISSPAIQFKGSGWYITDYPKKSSGDGAKSSSDGEKPANSSGTSSTTDSSTTSSSTSTNASSSSGGSSTSGSSGSSSSGS